MVFACFVAVKGERERKGVSSKCFSTSCGDMRHEPRLRTTSVAIGYSRDEELSH